jgi:glucose-1-phosphate thymidylyltransferase
MWGIVPAAGVGSRIQPLAFSKELLPVGSRGDGEAERPRAVSEYLVDRLILGGADRICFVIAPGKSDILEYYGARSCPAHLSFTVQPHPAGLCDAIFRALPLIPPSEYAFVGLPDTIWFPEDALKYLTEHPISFLLFPVDHPEHFDAVLTSRDGRVKEIKVKQANPGSAWVWGAFKLSGYALRELYDLWCQRDRKDEYIGGLVNAYLSQGGNAVAVPAGQTYVDVGTLRGYRDAIRVLSEQRLETAGVGHD